MDILQECAGAKSIAITGHIRPDGDCIGSSMAMALYLRKYMPEAEVDVYLEEPPTIYRCIKDIETIRFEQEEGKVYDVFICVDCAANRSAFSEDAFNAAKKKINIDHHETNPGCGDVNYIFPYVGSAAELVYEVMDLDKIDVDIALAIYIGIISDTGVMQYSNTRPETMYIVAELMKKGIDFANTVQKTFYEKTYVQTQILGHALLGSQLFFDDKCVVSMIDKKTMDFYEAKPKVFEGVVNQLRNIRGIDCAIFMYEIGPLEYKVSLRTSEAVDAVKVVTAFGGGGHARAAGVTMNGTYKDVVDDLSREIEKQIKNV